jgi:hypothetical protein
VRRAKPAPSSSFSQLSTMLHVVSIVPALIVKVSPEGRIRMTRIEGRATTLPRPKHGARAPLTAEWRFVS